MSIAARRTLPPPNMLARVFDLSERLGRLGPIARHVGEVGARHRLRGTAAAGVRRSDANQCREQCGGQYPQHVFLRVASMTRRQGITRTLIKLVSSNNFRAINGPMRRSPLSRPGTGNDRHQRRFSARLGKSSQSCPSGRLSDGVVEGHQRRRLWDAARRADHMGHRCRRQGPRPPPTRDAVRTEFG